MSKKPKTEEQLREEAFALLDEGWTSAEAAELLDIKTMTVAGWMSWRTRGHYAESGAPVVSIATARAIRDRRALRS